MIGYPLVLRHADVQRIVNRSASLLILTGTVRPGTCQIQDALIVRRNERHRKAGRFDLQTDPIIRTVEITHVDTVRLIDLDLAIVRAAGFKIQRDFYDDWLERRGHIDPSLEVRVCRFVTVEPVRMLHRRVHRGYTTNPALAAHGEPAALTAGELAKLSNAATQRYERERRLELGRRQAESIKARRRLAEARGDYAEAVRLTEDLADLARQADAA